MDFPDQDAYVLDNVLPRAYGCEIRKGWRHWIPLANKLTGAVNTIMTYQGSVRSQSRIFASPTGAAGSVSNIYDVTTQGVAPVLSKAPSTVSDVPGEWYYTNFVSQGGNFLLTVSSGAGYYTYQTGRTPTEWVEVLNVVGPPPTLPTLPAANTIYWPVGYSIASTKNIAFIWMWKNRVWFLMKNSSVAFYLPVGQMVGEAHAFDFGQQLNQGGSLLWASNWTYDSGEGIDDGLVLASTEGQIIVYQGTDPDNAATFQLKGRWYAGRFPYGRRNFCDHGGNIVFLCEYGVVDISDLVSGRLHTTTLSGSMGYKFNPRLSRQISDSIDKQYWFLHPYATEEMLVVGTPLLDMLGNRQTVAMNSVTSAWCTVSGMDFRCADVFYGQFIYGTADGMVNQAFFGNEDGVPADGLKHGDIVTARIQGAFFDYGEPNLNKRMLRVKLYGRSQSDPSFFARYLPEYHLEEPISAPTPNKDDKALWAGAPPNTADAVWDFSKWGEADGSFHKWFGVSGFGKKLSLQIAIRGSGQIAYTDHEALFEIGIGL